MKRPEPESLRSAPRCGAKTRAGTPCRKAALKGKSRCRNHGGKSPGPPRGAKNPAYRSGKHTTEAVTERKQLRALLRLVRSGAS